MPLSEVVTLVWCVLETAEMPDMPEVDGWKGRCDRNSSISREARYCWRGMKQDWPDMKDDADRSMASDVSIEWPMRWMELTLCQVFNCFDSKMVWVLGCRGKKPAPPSVASCRQQPQAKKPRVVTSLHRSVKLLIVCMRSR